MRSTAVSGNHGNQCAYDPFGNIIKTIPAAGSADYQTGVWWNVWDHYWHDVHPYEEADRLGWVTKYFSVRPVWTE